jgi:hypothetical protein
MLEFKVPFYLVKIHRIISNISNFRGASDFKRAFYLVKIHRLIPSPSINF